MSGIIVIEDVDGTELNQFNSLVFENLVAQPSSVDLFNQQITISGLTSYVSSYLKWSTIGNGTASSVFGSIPNLISVESKSGAVYYGDPNLSSSNTLNNLTDEEVYFINIPRQRPYVLQLNDGEKISHAGQYGFQFTFSSSGENWFPWGIDVPRNINLVFGGDADKITQVIDSSGAKWGPGNEINSLQVFQPGQGYIVYANTNFTLTVLEREDISTTITQHFQIQPPQIQLSETLTSSNLSNVVKFTVPAKVLKEAVLQVPVHSSITGLKQSEVNRYKDDDSTIPGAADIKTFYAARGLDTTFDTLMKLSDDYAGTVNVYNRLDFQADYNLKVLSKKHRDVTYIFKVRNNSSEIIAQSQTFTANELEKFDGNLVLRITNPVTPTSPVERFSFVIETDGAAGTTKERKFIISEYDRNRYGEPIQESLSAANANNPVFPERTISVVPFWNAGETLLVYKLYCTNPTNE